MADVWRSALIFRADSVDGGLSMCEMSILDSLFSIVRLSLDIQDELDILVISCKQLPCQEDQNFVVQNVHVFMYLLERTATYRSQVLLSISGFDSFP